jgi:hypothetical protein
MSSLHYVRIISNALWEDLEERGLLKSSDDTLSSKREILFSKIPQSLYDSADGILAKNKLLDWNEKLEIYDSRGNIVPKSNLASLLTKYVVKSNSFKFLPGSDEFLKLLVHSEANKIEESKEKVNEDWISFDSKFKSFKDKKHAVQSKFRKKTVLQSKKPRIVPSNWWLPQEQ